MTERPMRLPARTTPVVSCRSSAHSSYVSLKIAKSFQPHRNPTQKLTATAAYFQRLLESNRSAFSASQLNATRLAHGKSENCNVHHKIIYSENLLALQYLICGNCCTQDTDSSISLLVLPILSTRFHSSISGVFNVIKVRCAEKYPSELFNPRCESYRRI
jgi:hypothetical protein